MTGTTGGDDGRLATAMATLTPEQLAAVTSPAEALAIVAGAGSGKTRVVTLRVARRIADGTIDADHTLVATFSRKAAFELRTRLMGLGVPVADPTTSGRPPGPGVRAGTLHQLGLTLLRRRALDTGQPPPRVAEQRYRMLTNLASDPSETTGLDLEIGWAKARGLTPPMYAAGAAAAGRIPLLPVKVVADRFQAYEDALARQQAIDLDDVLTRAGDLIVGDPTFAEAVRWRYRHLSVDEFQDINPTQFRLVQLVMGDRRDLVAVGDPNQAIYGWNGADPGFLARLPGLVPGMEVVRLDRNHRSSPQVVKAAAAALGQSVDGIPQSSGSDGPMPVVTAYDDSAAEADGVARLVAERGGEGRCWSAHAVLARTNDQLTAMGAALARAGIPYRLAPGPESPVVDAAEGDAVELATFHRAKGLEWPWVAVVGIEDGYVPIIHASSDTALAEERRLLYVALTRAERQLHCSWARRRALAGGRLVERSPSPWLADIRRHSVDGRARSEAMGPADRFAQLRQALDR